MSSRHHVLGVLAALVLVLGGVAAGLGWAEESDGLTAAPKVAATTTSTTVPTTTTAVPTTTTAVPTTTTTAPPPPPPTEPPPRFTMDPYRGLGAWVDVFDWAVSYDRSPQDPPTVDFDDIDWMASLGVRTIYLQATRWDAPDWLVEQERLIQLIDRAHADGMHVVGWYLPRLEDPTGDRARIDSIMATAVDGLAIDIESVTVEPVEERNARIVQLSADLRAAYPREVLSAIVLPPVVTEVYGTYWGGFPWAGLAPYYDVWQTMGYWTLRPVSSGWRDAYTYTATNIDLLRQVTGRPDAVVHPVGGVACCEGPTSPTTAADVDGMMQAARERGAIGASVYDYATTGEDLWPSLQAANGL